MPTRSSEATWTGDATAGSGTVSTESSAVDAGFACASRFLDGDGTNPEELMAAAHASCFAMTLARTLEEHGYQPERLHVEAEVTMEEIDRRAALIRSNLRVTATLEPDDAQEIERLAEQAHSECPVSRALAGIDCTLSVAVEQPMLD